MHWAPRPWQSRSPMLYNNSVKYTVYQVEVTRNLLQSFSSFNVGRQFLTKPGACWFGLSSKPQKPALTRSEITRIGLPTGLCGCWGSKAGPCACSVSVLPTEPSPLPVPSIMAHTGSCGANQLRLSIAYWAWRQRLYRGCEWAQPGSVGSDFSQSLSVLGRIC